MTYSASPLLSLPIITTGTESGAWGNITNNGLTQYLDIAIAGSLPLTTDADVDLSKTAGTDTVTNIGSTTAQYMVLNCTGSRTVTRNINAPKQSKLYVVINATTGSQSVVLRGGPTSPTTGVTVANGTTVLCAWNGSDFVSVGVTTSLATPLTVVGNATAGAEIRVPEDTDNGSNYVAIKAPDNIASNATLTAPAVTDTLATIGTAQNFTAAQTFRAANAIRSEAASTQDAIVIAGRAGGTSSYAATITPPTLAANITLTTPSQTATLGYINVPQSGSAKTTAYTLATSDVGEFIEVGSGGSIEIPNSTFSAGDAVLVFNNTAGGITITCTITTAYIGGTDTDKATMTLATRGIASILFVSGTVCVVTGNVS